MQTFRGGAMRGPDKGKAPEPVIEPQEPGEFPVFEDENELVAEMKECAKYLDFLLESAKDFGLETLFKIKKRDNPRMPVEIMTGIEFERCQKLVTFK